MNQTFWRPQFDRYVTFKFGIIHINVINQVQSNKLYFTGSLKTFIYFFNSQDIFFVCFGLNEKLSI